MLVQHIGYQPKHVALPRGQLVYQHTSGAAYHPFMTWHTLKMVGCKHVFLCRNWSSAVLQLPRHHPLWPEPVFWTKQTEDSHTGMFFRTSLWGRWQVNQVNVNYLHRLSIILYLLIVLQHEIIHIKFEFSISNSLVIGTNWFIIHQL